MKRFLFSSSEIIIFIILGVIVLLINIPWLSLPFYWDTAWFLIPAAKTIAETGNIFSYFGGTDYPHTFLLPLTISLNFKLPINHTIGIHLYGVFLSWIFLIVMYYLGKTMANKWVGAVLSLVFLTNPLFLAQTHLVYFEIIGAAMRFLAVIFLFKQKHLWFLFAGLIAMFIRIDNGIFLILGGFIYFILFKNNYNLKPAWILKYTFPLFISIIIWLLIHYLFTGWVIYSPERYFEENPVAALTNAINYTLFSQGRIVISLLFIVAFAYLILMKRNKNLLNKNLIKQLLVLLSISVPSLFLIAKLGYFLPRYIFPVLPVLYLILFVLLYLVSTKTKMFLVMGFFLITFVQIFNLYNCEAGNFEDCLQVVHEVKNQD